MAVYLHQEYTTLWNKMYNEIWVLGLGVHIV